MVFSITDKKETLGRGANSTPKFIKHYLYCRDEEFQAWRPNPVLISDIVGVELRSSDLVTYR